MACSSVADPRHATADLSNLQRSNVVAVVAVGAKVSTSLPSHHVAVEDDGDDSMLRFLHGACDFIQQYRSQGAVLVHCKGGINRSPCLLVAYLMKYEELSMEEAFSVVSLARPAARCPKNFMTDLETFATQLQATRARAEEAEGLSEAE